MPYEYTDIAVETRPIWRRFRPGLLRHILLGVLVLLSASCQSEDASSDLPHESAAENPQPASGPSENDPAGESVEDEPAQETHFPIRIRLTAELPTEGTDTPGRSVRINSLLQFSSENLSVLDDPGRTRDWISGGVNPDPGGTGTPAKEFQALVQADDDVSGIRLCTLLNALAEHKLITRLTLVEDRDEETVRSGRDFEITFLKDPEKSDELRLPDIRVILKSSVREADPSVFLGRRNLGRGDTGFNRLNIEILKLIGRPDDPITGDMRVVVFTDDDVTYRHVRQTIRAVSGRDDRNGRRVTYIRNVALDGVGASQVTVDFNLTDEVQLRSTPDAVKPGTNGGLEGYGTHVPRIASELLTLARASQRSAPGGTLAVWVVDESVASRAERTHVVNSLEFLSSHKPRALHGGGAGIAETCARHSQ